MLKPNITTIKSRKRMELLPYSYILAEDKLSSKVLIIENKASQNTKHKKKNILSGSIDAYKP